MDGLHLGDVATIWGIAALFLLLSLVGGAFKFRGTEIASKISWPLRILAFFFFGVFFCGPFMWLIAATPVPPDPPPTSRTQPLATAAPVTAVIAPSPIPPSHPVLKAAAAAIWNYPGGYVIFTTDAAGSQVYSDYSNAHQLVSEGYWDLDSSFAPPLLTLAGYDYQANLAYVGTFDVYEAFMDGFVTADGVNTAALRLTFTP